MAADPRAAPQYAERVPYVVVCGEPGARCAPRLRPLSSRESSPTPVRVNPPLCTRVHPFARKSTPNHPCAFESTPVHARTPLCT
eukprot:513979-Prorocentrum_minimum.AAC.1